MNLKNEIETSKYEIGVIIGRFQIHSLHQGHIELINTVCENHKKVIMFLGMPPAGCNKANPLDFATRKAMIQEQYPDIVILPQMDNRSDIKWSENLDKAISLPFGEKSVLLYGSRDSFIPHYKGKYKVMELESEHKYSATECRHNVSREVLNTEDFRAGVIYSTYSQRPVTYPTVDVTAYNDKGQILLAKKPNEELYRFIGGFVDREDISWEHAAKREFREESGDCEIDDLKYVASGKINDWRYSKSESGIMTTLFLGRFIYGHVKASDDIAILDWVDPTKISADNIMPEHRELFSKLLVYMHSKKIISVKGFFTEKENWRGPDGCIEEHVTYNNNDKN